MYLAIQSPRVGVKAQFHKTVLIEGLTDDENKPSRCAAAAVASRDSRICRWFAAERRRMPSLVGETQEEKKIRHPCFAMRPGHGVDVAVNFLP